MALRCFRLLSGELIFGKEETPNNSSFLSAETYNLTEVRQLMIQESPNGQVQAGFTDYLPLTKKGEAIKFFKSNIVAEFTPVEEVTNMYAQATSSLTLAKTLPPLPPLKS